eukprot:UN03582
MKRLNEIMDVLPCNFRMHNDLFCKSNLLLYPKYFLTTNILINHRTIIIFKVYTLLQYSHSLILHNETI